MDDGSRYAVTRFDEEQTASFPRSVTLREATYVAAWEPASVGTKCRRIVSMSFVRLMGFVM